MSTPLRVELNGEAVHAVDAPAEFAASGPFFVELRNAGGPVHVHLHLDDDLSRAARLDGGNHYVEGGETKRVPVGVARGADPVSGRLKIVSGYGTETAYVTVRVDPDADGADASGDAASASDGGGASNAASEATSAGIDASGASGASGGPRAEAADRAAPSKERAEPSTEPAGTSSAARRAAGAKPSRGGRPKRSPTGDGASVGSVVGVLGTLREAVGAVGGIVGSASRGDAAFFALGGVALLVGVGVTAAARDAALTAVVGGVVLAVLSTVGWLLRG